MFVCSNSVIQCMLYILSIVKLLFMLFMFDYIILNALNILLEVSKLEYFLNSNEHILRGSFLATLVVIIKKEEIMKPKFD